MQEKLQRLFWLIFGILFILTMPVWGILMIPFKGKWWDKDDFEEVVTILFKKK